MTTLDTLFMPDTFIESVALHLKYYWYDTQCLVHLIDLQMRLVIILLRGSCTSTKALFSSHVSL